MDIVYPDRIGQCGIVDSLVPPPASMTPFVVLDVSLSFDIKSLVTLYNPGPAVDSSRGENSSNYRVRQLDADDEMRVTGVELRVNVTTPGEMLTLDRRE